MHQGFSDEAALYFDAQHAENRRKQRKDGVRFDHNGKNDRISAAIRTLRNERHTAF